MKYKYKVIRVPDSYIMPAPGGVVTYTSSSDFYKVEEKEAMSLKKLIKTFDPKKVFLVKYKNKKGKKTMKHYVGKHYWTKQPKEEEPTLVYGWSIQITEETVELYDIDNKGNLIANKDKFQRYYDSM